MHSEMRTEEKLMEERLLKYLVLVRYWAVNLLLTCLRNLNPNRSPGQGNSSPSHRANLAGQHSLHKEELHFLR